MRYEQVATGEGIAVADAVLELERVTKRYGQVTAVRECSLAARGGEILGVVGPEGAGATTLLRIAAGVLTPDSGRVSWRSGPLTQAGRARLGYLPQRRGLYPTMTVLDQLVFLAELHGLDTNRAHRNALLWIDRLGLRANRGRRVSALDEAARQRVELAGVLGHEPDALVLDQPFAGLSEIDVETWCTVLRGLASAGAAVLLSASAEVAERACDRITVLRSGQLVSVGSPSELRGSAARLAIVDIPGADADWAAGLAHCRVRDRVGSRAILELSPEADAQAVLAAAEASGAVAEFTLRSATLADLYAEPAGGRT